MFDWLCKNDFIHCYKEQREVGKIINTIAKKQSEVEGKFLLFCKTYFGVLKQKVDLGAS